LYAVIPLINTEYLKVKVVLAKQDKIILKLTFLWWCLTTRET